MRKCRIACVVRDRDSDRCRWWLGTAVGMQGSSPASSPHLSSPQGLRGTWLAVCASVGHLDGVLVSLMCISMLTSCFEAQALQAAARNCRMHGVFEHQ